MYKKCEGGESMGFTRKNLNIPDEIIKDIEEFKKRNFMTSFTGAIIELVRRGLKYKE